MSKIKRALGLSISVAAMTLMAGAAMGQISTRTDWPSVNHDNTSVRYSPLTQVKPATSTTWTQDWVYHLKPDGFTGRLRYDESIPIVIGNTMYLGSPYGEVIALNATTGAVKWKFKLPGDDTPAKRGISYWPGDGKMPASDHLRHRKRHSLFAQGRRTARPTPGSATTAPWTSRRPKS